MVRWTYRWLPRTIIPNLRGAYWDIHCGIKNLWRWLPVIWFDHDCDWYPLAEIMEKKFRMMADLHEHHGHLVGAHRYAHQLRTCAALCRRIRDDNYFENAGYRRRNRFETPFGRSGEWAAKHSNYMGDQDTHYLGMIIGKYLRHWWD